MRVSGIQGYVVQGWVIVIIMSSSVRKANSELELSQLLFISIRQRELVRVLVLSLSLDDSRITRDECLGRTWWSSPLDFTTYLYYFYKWLCPIITWSHVLLEPSMFIWLCHMLWLLNLPMLFISWLHYMTWYWRLNVQMRRKLFPLRGSHNTSLYWVNLLILILVGLCTLYSCS